MEAKKTNDSLELLNAVYWQWADQVMTKDPISLDDPETEEPDANLNAIASVNIGLSNYGYLAIMQKVGKLLMLKKKEQIRLKKTKSTIKQAKIVAKIEILHNNILMLRQQVADYIAKAKPRAVYVYIQFQSMNGKQKFLQAMKVSPAKRCMINCC